MKKIRGKDSCHAFRCVELKFGHFKLRLAKYAFLVDSGEAWQVFRELMVFVDKSGWTYTLRENVAPTNRLLQLSKSTQASLTDPL